MANIDIDKLQSSPETAVKHGEKYYKAELENEKTGEKTYTARPIFAVENKDKKLTVHPAFLAEFFRLTENIVYLRNNALGTEIRYIYQNGVYIQINNNDLDKILLDYVAKFKFSLQTVHTVANARELIDKKSEKIVHNKMNEAEEYINFQNGLLDINTMEILPHTDEIFSTIQIPCNWSENYIETPIFDNFLTTFTKGNKDKQRLLLEYFGAVISNVNGSRFKKCLFLVGSGDSGKSLISNLIIKLIGDQNASERSLERLTEAFGKSGIYMKRFVYSSDLSFQKLNQMNVFKELTGGDMLEVVFKNHEGFDYLFRGLMLFCMNDLPMFGGDKGSHVYNRMLVVKCDNPIPKHKQDQHLLEKLFAEREGIIRKCVLAFRKVLNNNFQFNIPEECNINCK